MKNLKSKSIVEGGILTGIIVLLMFISNIPGISLLGCLLVPIPVAILYIKNGLKMSILSIVVGFIFITLILGPIYGLTSIIIAGFIGIGLGIGVRSKKSGVYTLIYILIGTVISIVSTSVIYIYMIMNMTLNQFLLSIISQNKVVTKQMLKVATSQEMKDHINYIESMITIQNMQIALPIVVILISFISAVIIFIVSRNILIRLGFKFNNLISFTKWYIDPKFIAAIVVIALIGMELKKNGIPLGIEVFIGALGSLALLFGLQTMSLVAYFLVEKVKIAKGFVVVIIFFLLISGLIGYIFIIGLVDVFFDYRGLDEDSLGSIIRKKLNSNI
ncbi:DUF2232 domain-containing protein [uncultured Clostridium sp.]|uniref:DUF2232 domain-containing protein n=1 Tax=uncultured Clostridium sp. TaxID=59620 RepID=UPI00260FD0C2|nr:DUF2232 domain-containing protein [uncultured Clostridium sp.]